MNKFILVCVLISGCSFTYQGFDVYDRQVDTYISHNQFKMIINYSLSKLGEKDLFDKYDIVFTSAWLGQRRLDGKINVADGFIDIENKVIYIKVKECIWDTAIIHEMAHVIHYNAYKIYDIGHKDIAFWSVIDMLENEAVKFCPKGYIKTKRIN